VAPQPPTDELARAGWRLVYTRQPNAFMEASDDLQHTKDQWYSYGIRLNKDDRVTDVREGSPAWSAGIAPGMKIMAVDGQAYTDEVLKYVSERAVHSTAPTAFLVQQDGWYRTLAVNY